MIDKETIEATYKNSSLTECAKTLGISRYKLKKLLIEYEIPIKGSAESIKFSTEKSLMEKVSKNELQEYYVSHNISQCCEKFNLSRPSILKLLSFYDIDKHSQAENIKLGVKNLYGCDNVMQDATILSSHKELMRSKYEGNYYFQTEEFKNKNKETLMAKYGVKHSSQIPDSRKKAVKTNISRFGKNNYSNRAQAIATNINKYGVKAPLQNPEILKKSSDAIRQKYGVPYNCMRPEARVHNKDSSINKMFAELLSDRGIFYEREFILGNYSYDFKIDKILIELNPSITHNITFSPFGHTVDMNYHLDKRNYAYDNGYKCICVWDWDDINKIISLISYEAKGVGARNCEVKEVSKAEASEFLDAHHLQGAVASDINIALLYNNDIISLMTFGKPRYNKNYAVELLRYCTSQNVIGGAEKLFSYYINTYAPTSIISYCDLSKFNGEVYKRLGFDLISNPKPSKHWFNLKTQTHVTDNLLRQLGADKILGTSFGKGSSNEQIMKDFNFVEVYDCGQATYVWKL